MTDKTKNEEISGLSNERLAYLKSVIEDDVAKQRYYGAAIVVARHGEAGLHETIGYADAEQKRSLAKDSVFSLFSTTKAL
ncbi:MAG: serine hydrolase, partial [Gammaproteobacteria bacterium]